jgi:hypothetical protein
MSDVNAFYAHPETRYENDWRQIKITFVLLAIMAVISVGLIVYAVSVA